MFVFIQSYCLKVKEMDDEEYSCIVSSRAHRLLINNQESNCLNHEGNRPLTLNVSLLFKPL